MDDSLIIYSSIFILIIFIILYKFTKLNILLSLGIPVGLSIVYILFNSYSIPDLENSLEVLTDMPDF